jgi:hypothetical protein
MSTFDNAPPLDGWTVPKTRFCARLLGDDRCNCVDCQLDAHEPLDGRGDN